MTNNIKVFGKEIIDENAIWQLQKCVDKYDAIGVLTADAHYGYGHPIGGAVAYKNKISLSGVGFDIACGNKAVLTNLMANDVDIKSMMDIIVKEIGFGIGRPNPKPIDNEVFDLIAKANFNPQRKLIKLAQEQLGTVGSGNHFIDLFEDKLGRLWVGVHFGSRGFGHKTTTGFIALSKGLSFNDFVNEGGMDSPPILFDLNSQLGQDYIEAMQLAGEYAYAGRNVVINKVLQILGAKSTFEVHNHHNFAWKETHFGEQYWVVRKGCTPAFPNQLGFIGANMADVSVIVEGVDSELSKQALYSTVHGAGRVMSRRKAAGKQRWDKDEYGRKRLKTIEKGAINFDEVRALMRRKKIELRGAAADEAPDVYKNLNQVLDFHEGTINVLHHLYPIGVAMAGENEFDPYKD